MFTREEFVRIGNIRQKEVFLVCIKHMYRRFINNTPGKHPEIQIKSAIESLTPSTIVEIKQHYIGIAELNYNDLILAIVSILEETYSDLWTTYYSILVIRITAIIQADEKSEDKEKIRNILIIILSKTNAKQATTPPHA